MNHSKTERPKVRTGMKIGGQIAGGILILFIGIGIGSYPDAAAEDVRRGPVGEVMISFPSEDSYCEDYRGGMLHIWSCSK